MYFHIISHKLKLKDGAQNNKVEKGKEEGTKKKAEVEEDQEPKDYQRHEEDKDVIELNNKKTKIKMASSEEFNLITDLEVGKGKDAAS